VLGEKVSTPEGRALVERALKEGHRIGNHTFSHRVLGRLDAPAALEEIEQAEQALAFVEPPVRLFRPVGGGELGPHLLHPAAVEKLRRGAYTCVLWNCVPGDWRDPHGWLPRALAGCRNADWPLVVLHDVPTGAMAHLDDFLKTLVAEGFEITREFPPDCVPIVGGEVVRPLSLYLTAAR
jgi:peptidoglycan/xylan/chitin deacetylase (PgdA/CDA1 family)